MSTGDATLNITPEKSLGAFYLIPDFFLMDNDLTAADDVTTPSNPPVSLPTNPPILSPTNPPASATTITVQAESYLNMQSVKIEDTTDEGSSKNVGYIDSGDWMSYPEVTIPSTGAYTVEYQVSSNSQGGCLQLEKAGGTLVYGSLSFAATSDWQRWVTVSHTVNLEAGLQFFSIKSTGSAWNLNWFRITKFYNQESFMRTTSSIVYVHQLQYATKCIEPRQLIFSNCELFPCC